MVPHISCQIKTCVIKARIMEHDALYFFPNRDRSQNFGTWWPISVFWISSQLSYIHQNQKLSITALFASLPSLLILLLDLMNIPFLKFNV